MTRVELVTHTGRELGEHLQRALARLARLLRLLDVGFEQRHEGVVDLVRVGV